MIMLCLALMENLWRISLQIAKGGIDRNLAGYWTDPVILTTETKSKSMVVVVADLASSVSSMSRAFIAEFVRKLERQRHVLHIPLT